MAQSVTFSVLQLGARRHYVVPRILHSAGMLDRLFTDISATSWPFSLLQLVPNIVRPGSLRRLSERVPQSIPRQKITCFPSFGIRYSRGVNNGRRSAHWVQGGKEFCQLAIRHGFGSSSGIYGFTGAALEALREANQQGRLAVLDQIMVPRAIESRLLQAERERFPNWDLGEPADPDIAEYCQREFDEWQAADLILCGSPFVRDGVVSCGGDAAKCQVIAYGASADFEVPNRERHSGPLRVLFVGETGLRKGSPWVLEAARMMAGSAVFRMVGAVACGVAAERELRRHVELTGVVPRSDILKQLHWADVFLLPSLCEGSAGSIFEALSAGLPVVCTPNAGSVVQDGVEGLLVPPSDGPAIVAALEQLNSDLSLWRQMSRAAEQTAKRCSVDDYGTRLTQLLLGAASDS